LFLILKSVTVVRLCSQMRKGEITIWTIRDSK
jgi:hypothetical protein